MPDEFVAEDYEYERVQTLGHTRACVITFIDEHGKRFTVRLSSELASMLEIDL